MKLPSPKQLEPLVKLTRTRERAAMAELGRVATKRNAAVEHVAELQARRPEAQTLEDAAILEKWQIWREGELRTRQGHLAKCTADFAVAAKTCGRIIAEHVVVKNLSNQAEADVRRERETRRLETLNLLSHLLSNDVGDKDV